MKILNTYSLLQCALGAVQGFIIGVLIPKEFWLAVLLTVSELGMCVYIARRHRNVVVYSGCVMTDGKIVALNRLVTVVGCIGAGLLACAGVALWLAFLPGLMFVVWQHLRMPHVIRVPR